MIQLTWLRLHFRDTPRHHSNCTHTPEAAHHFGLVIVSCKGVVLRMTRFGGVHSAMSGDGFHASVDLNLCNSLVAMLSPDTGATARARRRYRSRSLALVLLDMCHDPCVRERMSSGQSGQLSGVGVRPMNVLSEKSKHSSCSSVHIHYNPTPTRTPRSHMARCAPLTMFLCTEVVERRETKRLLEGPKRDLEGL